MFETLVKMQSSSEGTLLDIIDLAHSLRQEQLFIANEQNSFVTLHDRLSTNSCKILQLAWICAQQRQNLNNLIVAKPDNGPSICCQRANFLENTKFLDIYKNKAIKYQHVLAYIELFNYLHGSPYLLGQCLAIGDRINGISTNKMNSVIQTIANGLYGSGIYPKDVEMMLKLLQELIEIQIVVSDNPRRMLRTGSSSFARLYNCYHESAFSAKLFLTAVLHEPIMTVLIQDDRQLEMDHSKLILNKAPDDNYIRGNEDEPINANEDNEKYREETVEALFSLVNRFIKSLSANWVLFPSTLRWLVQTMCHFLKQAQVSDENINAILTDMVFTNFICPAVVSPDIYGISDAPISENARFNLIQIGQILQMLALIKYQCVDSKLKDLYGKFDKSIISNLLEQLYPNEFEIEGMGINMISIPQHQNNIGRGAVLVTQNELNVFVDFLRSVLEQDGLIISGEDRRKLGEILEQLPHKLENFLNGDGNQMNHAPVIGGAKPKQTLKNKLAKTMSLNSASSINALVPTATIIDFDDNTITNHSVSNHNNNLIEDYDQVLIIPITISDDNKFHLLSEDEVLNMNNISNEIQEQSLTEKNVEELSRRNEKSETLENGIVKNDREKHTRFSLTHDDASIGNASDNLEAVSEAHSNHSVASSLEELEENDQNDNDNLSDMVSANVSGRGTPNISGRDTPSSQVTEGGGEAPQIPTPQMTKILNKTRSDIEDKFCKFEIRKLIEGDETISIISDTWSTDVLASDSETIEANERNFSTPLIPASVVLPGDHNYDPLSEAGLQLRANNLDISETQSESAWSTDVLASDSEKMTEMDTDDNQSIAARSDTTDSALRDREQEVPVGVLNRTPDSPYYGPRVPNINLRALDSSLFVTPRTPESPFSGRSYDDSPRSVDFTPRLQDDLARFTNNPRFSVHSGGCNSPQNFLNNQGEIGAVGGVNHHNRPHNHFVSERNLNYGISNSTRTTIYDRLQPSLSLPTHQLYVAPSQHPLRQNSTESYSSNHSCNFENDKFISPLHETNENGIILAPNLNKIVNNANAIKLEEGRGEDKKQLHALSLFKNSNQQASKENKSTNTGEDTVEDFIDLNNDYDDELALISENSVNNNDASISNKSVIKTSSNIINPFSESDDYNFAATANVSTSTASLANNNNNLNNIDLLLNNDDDDDLNCELPIEHRRTSSEQRNANFDSRRNGMIDLQGNLTSSIQFPMQTIVNSNGLDFMTLPESASVTDDYKNQRNTIAAMVAAGTSSSNSQLKSPNLIKTAAKHVKAISQKNNNVNEILLVQKTQTLTLAEAKVPKPSTTTKGSGKSTGAIPKSISFDSSADKVDRNSVSNLNVDNGSNRRSDNSLGVNSSGFFSKIKRGFKIRHSINMGSNIKPRFNGNGQHNKENQDMFNLNHNVTNGRHNQFNNLNGNNGEIFNQNETSEDILAKYRRKASSSSDAATSDSTGSNNSSSLKSKSTQSDNEQRLPNGGTTAENTAFFTIAKRKLRLVLSSTDLFSSDFRHNCCGSTSPLLMYLQIQLAQALNNQNLQQISYVSELLRCLNSLDITSHQKLLDELQQDLINRQSYIQYLIRYRQYLLSSIENIIQFEDRLQNDRNMSNKHLIMVCVRMFLEKREQIINKFHSDFMLLTVVDEKMDLLDEFMNELMNELRNDGVLYGMASWQLEEARNCIERILLQRLYRLVMFPNEDGDLSRDQVLYEHIRKLSRGVSPTHPLLRIPHAYLNEAPWPFSQKQISYISAYKTPTEKVQCVVKCVTSILNLLSMATERVPAADDLTPVLIYVIIKANPPYLLSTIEYVNCFIGDKLTGETQYWWTQFCSAVTFIKTMDYGE